MRTLSTILIPLLLGCAAKDGDGDTVSCSISGLSGVANATIDGQAWAGNGGTWREAGSAIQIDIESVIDLTITLRGTKDSNGDSIADRVSDGSLPVTIDLSGADGHGGVRDQRNGLDSYATNQPGGSGTLSILDVSGNTLSACFEFDAVSSGGVIMQVRDGKVKIDG
jgi:hypothetical protein